MIERKSFRFDVKANDEKPGLFTGRASVYGVVDFHNDVVQPGAFTEHLQKNGPRIKVLNQHNPMDPIGVAELTDSDTALLANGQLVLDLPSAKNMHVCLTNGLVDGISIGYMVPPDGYTYEKGVRLLQKLELVEISLVTFPANDYARVTDVKAAVEDKWAGIDETLRLASWAMAEVKAGRVLSAANLAKVKAAFEALKELLAVAEPPAVDTDEQQKFLATGNAFLENIRQARELLAR